MELTLKEFILGPYKEATNPDIYWPQFTRIRHNFERFFGLRLSEITPLMLESWRKENKHKAPSTLNRDIATLQSVFTAAVNWEYCKENPAKKVKSLRVDKVQVVRYLSDSEEKRLYSAIIADPLKPIVTMALNTGLRRGELFNLKWHDLNFDKKQLVVRGDGAKSGQTRYVPLNLRVINSLPDQKSEYVFCDKDGKKLTQIRRGWDRIAKQAELVDFRFHDLRHSFASKLVTNGVDLNIVRDLLGHATIEMTLRYAHLSDDVKHSAVGVL